MPHVAFGRMAVLSFKDLQGQLRFRRTKTTSERLWGVLMKRPIAIIVVLAVLVGRCALYPRASAIRNPKPHLRRRARRA